MKVFLNYLWRLWLLILVVPLTLIFGLPTFFLSGSLKNYPRAYRYVRAWGVCIFYGMGFRYKMFNPKHLNLEPGKPYVLISNHTSIMDIMLMLVLHPHHPFFFVGKKELSKIPIFGMLYKRICVLVDRDDPKSRADVYRRCAERMQLGHSIVIFPEGGVDDAEDVILSDFKTGAFNLAQQHSFDTAVYAFYGLKQMFPFLHHKGYPGCVKVHLLDILPPDREAEDAKLYTHTLIYNTLKSEYENH